MLPKSSQNPYKFYLKNTGPKNMVNNPVFVIHTIPYLCSLLLFLLLFVFAVFDEKSCFQTSEFDPWGIFGV